MILIVAPYTGNSGNASITNLGASKKIRSVVSILSKISNRIVLINSAHNSLDKKSFIEHDIEISGIKLKEIVLPTIKKRPIGKLLNLFDVTKAIDLIKKEGEPELIWFYNGYAFEMSFAKAAFKAFKSPMIMEFEDWHFSRSRKLSVKTWFDFAYWRVAVKRFSRVYAINASVKQRVDKFCDDVLLLPGVVAGALIKQAEKRLPFPDGTDQVHVGYFGGLSKEKGADIVLQLAEMLPANFSIHVTGGGSLASDFKAVAQSSGGKLNYYGMVTDEELINIICKCDIQLNPHQPMENFKNGIFPFKVIEAIASGRMLISTKLSFEGFEELAQGVKFVEHDADSFARAITGAKAYFNTNKELIRQSSLKTRDMFSEDSIVSSIKTLTGIKH